MVSHILPILALVSAVLSHPSPHYERHRAWRYWGTGRPSSVPNPTGSLPSSFNSTAGGAPVEPPSGADSGVQTLTVNAVPAPAATVTTAAVPDILEPESSAVLDSTGTVTAAAFFGRPPQGGNGFPTAASGEASVSVPAVVPTTFATAVSQSYGGVAPASSSAGAPIASSPPSTGGGSSGGKKGLSYNVASLTNAFSGKGISWAYNWAATPDGSIVDGAEYVPMLWGLNSVSAWSGAAAQAISNGAKHALSFNEPDLGEQANIDPSTAAQSHIANMNPLGGQVAIGSPAVTNGAGTNPLMGVDWLKAWFKACDGQCKVDFVAFHWYDSASNFAYFKKHVQDVIDAAAANGVGKVWLTEFGASGSDSEVASFITQAVAFLEATPAVERYAYFMTSDGILVNGNSLSSLGSAYAS